MLVGVIVPTVVDSALQSINHFSCKISHFGQPGIESMTLSAQAVVRNVGDVQKQASAFMVTACAMIGRVQCKQ